MTLAKSDNPLSDSPKTATDTVKLSPCDLWSDEPPSESDWHREQIDLLLACLKWDWRDGQRPTPQGYHKDYYASGNLPQEQVLEEQQQKEAIHSTYADESQACRIRY